MRYAVIFTMAVGQSKQRAVEAFIEDVPEDVKASDVAEALGNSRYAPEFSERGIFLANRRVTAEARIPKGTDARDATAIEWKTLAGTGSVQLNMRIPAREKAVWEMAASREGFPKVTAWMRHHLNHVVERDS